jgi:hypothetical protein
MRIFSDLHYSTHVANRKSDEPLAASQNKKIMNRRRESGLSQEEDDL